MLNAARVDDDAGGSPQPAWCEALLAEVDRVFTSTGADTPGWPDPHGSRGPLGEEYSRLTDPGKYRILESRVDAWVQVLSDAGLVDVLDVPAETWTDGCRPPDQHLRVRRLEPERRGGLVLLIATTLVGGVPFGLDVGICRGSERPVRLATLPACGCDACDGGSTDLLSELDGWVLTLALGGTLHARRGDDSATRTFDGWSTANGGEKSWLEESSSVPNQVERWVGVPWADHGGVGRRAAHHR